MERLLRSALRALAVVALSVSGLSAECAPYVTSSFEDGPHSGTLLGTETVTYSISGGGLGYKGSYSVSYEVGYYEMENGDIVRLDCRSYDEVRML